MLSHILIDMLEENPILVQTDSKSVTESILGLIILVKKVPHRFITLRALPARLAG